MITVITKSGMRETTRAQFDFVNDRGFNHRDGVGRTYELYGSDPASGEQFVVCEVPAEKVEYVIEELVQFLVAQKTCVAIDLRTVDASPGFVPPPPEKPVPPKKTAPVKKVALTEAERERKNNEAFGRGPGPVRD